MEEGKRDKGKERKLKHSEGRNGDEEDGKRSNAKVMSLVESGDGNLCLQVSIARLSETHRAHLFSIALLLPLQLARQVQLLYS